MSVPDLPWRPLRVTTTAGNLLGAILTFFYFRVVDPESAATAGGVSLIDIAISVAAFVALVTIAYPLGRRWSSPLIGFTGDTGASPRGPRRRLRAPSSVS